MAAKNAPSGLFRNAVEAMSFFQRAYDAESASSRIILTRFWQVSNHLATSAQEFDHRLNIPQRRSEFRYNHLSAINYSSIGDLKIPTKDPLYPIYENMATVETKMHWAIDNPEIRRRTGVVGTFPDGQSALMPVAARLKCVAESEWGSRRYLDVSLLDE